MLMMSIYWDLSPLLLLILVVIQLNEHATCRSGDWVLCGCLGSLWVGTEESLTSGGLDCTQSPSAQGRLSPLLLPPHTGCGGKMRQRDVAKGTQPGGACYGSLSSTLAASAVLKAAVLWVRGLLLRDYPILTSDWDKKPSQSG